MEHSLPIVSTSSAAHGEVFAQVPLNLPAQLADELVQVQNPSLVLTNYSLERRQLFQDLLYRYFRQILYGCKNPRCSFPSCRSHRKRISRGPFRDFTNLSAWTLATFLATQDNAERGLCSNEPAITPHGSGKYMESKNVDQTPISNAAGLKTLPQHGDVSGNTQPPHRKDFKSFTQNLFDTAPMKLLRSINVPGGFFEWRLRENAADEKDDAIETDKIQNTDELLFEDSLQSELLSHEKNNKAADSQDSTVALRRNGVDMKGFMPGLYYLIDDRFRVTFNAPDLALVDSSSQFSTELGRNYPEVDAGLTQYVFAHSAQGSRSEFTEPLSGSHNNNHEYLVDDQFPCMPFSADSRSVMPPRSLSRFTMENLAALSASFEIFNPTISDEHNFPYSFDSTASSFRLDLLVSETATRHESEIAFLSQSIIFVMSSPDSLLESFRDPDSELENAQDEYEFLKIVHAFTLFFKVDFLEQCVFSSLRNSANKLYPPKHDYSQNSNSKRSLGSEPLELNTGFENSPTREKVLNDKEAMHIVKIALAALIARVLKGKLYGNVWVSFCNAHAKGRAIRHDTQLMLMDIFEDELCIELMTVLIKAMVIRKHMSEIIRHREPQLMTGENLQNSSENIINKLLHNVFHLSPSTGIMPTHVARQREMSRHHAEILMQWLRSVILKSWDGKALINRWGAVGCALEFMSHLFQMSDHLGIDPSSFETPFLFTQLNVNQLPTEWLHCQRDHNSVHLLFFRFLFSREILVSYFRAINYAGMLKAYNGSVAAEKLAESLYFVNLGSYLGRFGKVTNKFLVLELRRENILTDAMNELWRRERYELMRPLKIHIGGQEEEEGVDQGGVQQEFMRIATSESMRPDYGLFTTDDQTQMSWFLPFSFEPLYKFELLGLITSLAVYNGLTIPVNFPLALYRKLLNLPVTRLEHIRDGWPSLARGLRDLLDWTGESVENVFARSYCFSVEVFGETIDIELEEIESDGDWPSTQRSQHVAEFTETQVYADSSFMPSKSKSRKPSTSSQLSAGKSDGSTASDPSANSPSFGPVRDGLQSRRNSIASRQSCMVTNENRDRYVKDYIFWLTDKSIRPQYEAFAQGFFTCIEPKAITIFSAEDLKSVVEGIQEIDVDELWDTATYDNGYSPSHRVIEDFWHVVRDLSPAQLRQLLEFVTASDRVPAMGLRSVQFVILKNGDSDERLPTSTTCFGKLLLPEYSSRSVLKERLCTAIEHCKGFGLS